MARDLAGALKHAPLRAPAPLFDRQRAPRGVFDSQPGFLRALGALAVVFVIVLPFLDASRYTMSIATSALIYVMLCMGLNVVVGFAGLLDLGYIAFFAVGSYVSGIFTTVLGLPMWLALPATILACVVAGIVIGAPTLRLRSDYLAIVTLGFGEIIRITANNLDITGGPSGIHGIPTWEFFGWSFADGFTIGGIEFPERVVFYYFVALVVIVVGVIGAGRLGRGKLGRAWKAVRDDEDAAEAMGINTYVAKISAYIIGAVWAGMAGQLMATHLSAISPNSFQFLYSTLILMAVVLGGMGSTPGVIIGALFVSLAPELLRDFAEWRFLLFGVLLIVVMLFRPAGLWPATAVLPWLKRRRPAPPPSTSAVGAVGAEQGPGSGEGPGSGAEAPSVMESVDGVPAADAEEGRGA